MVDTLRVLGLSIYVTSTMYIHQDLSILQVSVDQTEPGPITYAEVIIIIINYFLSGKDSLHLDYNE